MNLEDIARKAGVSRSTVSRVINNARYVKDDVRARVLAVIAEEGFRPNPAARTLVTRRSQIIGVTIAQTANVFFGTNSYFPMLLQGIAEALNARDHALLLWMGEDDEPRADFARRVLRSRQVDGLIITSIAADDPLYAALVAGDRRFVMVETPPNDSRDVNCVTVDNEGAARCAVEHLIAIGRRRIAHITGTIGIQDAVERLRGYQAALTDAGLPVDPDLIVYGAFQHDAGYQAMQRLLAHQPDAVFAAGDTIAVGALQALSEAGIDVPGAIAVVGFDDLDIAAQAGLTTIAHNIQSIGSHAAHLLIDLIEGQREHPQRLILPTELVIRRSTVAGVV